MEEVLILSDSMFKHCEAPRNTRLIVFRGAKINTIVREVRNGKINFRGVKLCILHLGTNDINGPGFDLIYPRYWELTKIIRNKVPGIEIIVSGILPRPVDLALTTSRSKAANRELKAICQAKKYLHFNTTYKGFLYNNKPRLGLFDKDGLHLSHKGAQKIAQIVKNLIGLWKQKRLTFK
jgi:lysophospholipase L1-like esterase